MKAAAKANTNADAACEAVDEAQRQLASRLRLRHLHCFVAIARERTLARAAARLHLNQPAVSKTLVELEEWAGVSSNAAGTARHSRRRASTSCATRSTP
ncbi:transcriptional regulator, LysR family, partial [Burkholderia sp. H160]